METCGYNMFKYARVESKDTIRFLDDMPQWYGDDGKVLTEEELKNHGIYKVEYTKRPTNIDEMVNYIKEYFDVDDILKTITFKYKIYIDENSQFDKRKYIINFNNSDVFEYDEEKNIVKNRSVLIERSLSEIYNNLKLEIERKRDRAISYDFTYNDIVVQLRNPIDYKNLSNLSTESLYRIISNIEDEFIFRDKNNTIHNISPKTMFDLYTRIQDRNRKIYKYSWDLKNKIKEIYESDKPDNIKIDELLCLPM